MFRMNILRRELRLNRRSFFIWASVMVIFIGIYLGFFPYMQDPDMVAALEAYPETLKAAFAMSPATFQDVNQYHGGLVMAYGLLLATIYSLMLAGGLVARDADVGTAEFLYTKPVTRNQIMWAKVSAFLLIIVLLWIVAFAASTVVGLAVVGDEFSLGTQSVVHLAGLLATMAAGGVAFSIAPFINQAQTTTSLGVGIGLVFFLVDAVSKMTDRLDALKYVTIQYYADLQATAAGEPFVTGLLFLFFIFVLGTGLGFLFLNRKEFTA